MCWEIQEECGRLHKATTEEYGIYILTAAVFMQITRVIRIIAWITAALDKHQIFVVEA